MMVGPTCVVEFVQLLVVNVTGATVAVERVMVFQYIEVESEYGAESLELEITRYLLAEELARADRIADSVYVSADDGACTGAAEDALELGVS
jgi:hypothetical protein